MRISFFKTPKPRQFNYLPRYYDQEKDAREERRRELLGPDASSPDGDYKPGEYIRSHTVGRRGKDMSSRNRQHKAGPVRMLLLLALMGLAVWWILS